MNKYKKYVMILIVLILVSTVSLLVYRYKLRKNIAIHGPNMSKIEFTFKKMPNSDNDLVNYSIALSNHSSTNLRHVNAFLSIPVRLKGEINADYSLITLQVKYVKPDKQIIRNGETINMFASASPANFKKYLNSNTEVDYDHPYITIEGYSISGEKDIHFDMSGWVWKNKRW
jgi:hypothetical protein